MNSSYKGPRVRLQPTYHYCTKKSGELGKDEIYYSLASGADSGHCLGEKQVTSEIGSVKSGHGYNFPSGYVLFDGRVNQTLSAHIVCWEADDSNSDWYDKLIRVSYEISRLSTEMQVLTGDPIRDELLGQLPGYSMRQEVLFWVQHISRLVGNFLELFRNHDDKVAEVYLSWNLPALDHMFMGNSKYETAVRFNGGGGGDHTLYISRVRQHDNYPGQVVTTLTSSKFAPGSLTFWQRTDGNNVNGTVTTAEYGGKLYSVVVLDRDGSITTTDKPLVHANDLRSLGLGKDSPTRTDMIADDAGLTIVAQGFDQRLCLYTKWHTSSSWTETRWDHYRTSKAPNICILNNRKVCIFYNFDGEHQWMKSYNDSWAAPLKVPAHTPSPYPAGACVLEDAIYYFYADAHFKIRVAIIYEHEIENYKPSIVDYGLSPFETRGGISATVWGGKIYIAYSTVNPDRRPCIDRYDVDQQRLVSVRVFDDWCPAGDPALGVDNGCLRLTFRKP